MTRRRRGSSPAPQSSPLEDDDLLREILVRLPSQPSSLPRASAVCKRWLGLVTDPKFAHQFRIHHRKPPLLGVFEYRHQQIVFSPISGPPDRIPPERFDLGSCCADVYLLECRHGRVLVKSSSQTEVFVYAPITGERCCVAVPPEFERCSFEGALLCAADDQGHVHGSCHSSPFKVVLVSTESTENLPYVRVYSSETGKWGTLISTEAPCDAFAKPAVLVGSCLYWLSMGGDVLEFDLGEPSLTVIRGPLVTDDIFRINCQIIQTENGVVGYANLSYLSFQMWQRNINGHGVATWVPWKTIEMVTILKPPPPTKQVVAQLVGYDDDSDILFLSARGDIYTVQLKSMQSTKLYEGINTYGYHPFKSFYTPAIAGGFNGA